MGTPLFQMVSLIPTNAPLCEKLYVHCAISCSQQNVLGSRADIVHYVVHLYTTAPPEPKHRSSLYKQHVEALSVLACHATSPADFSMK